MSASAGESIGSGAMPATEGGAGNDTPAGGVAGLGDVATSAGAGGGLGGNATVPTDALIPVDGWVDGSTNVFGIQGEMAASADATSGTGLVANFAASNACIQGVAAKVDLKCTPVAPATDCYGTFWGARISLNLNQSREGDGFGSPLPYDASAITGFAFKLTGASVPASLRLTVEDATTEYCTPPAKPLKLGNNVVLFSDLLTQCWKAGGQTAARAKSELLRVSWQVVTSDKSTVPFDFCVEDLRALP